MLSGLVQPTRIFPCRFRRARAASWVVGQAIFLDNQVDFLFLWGSFQVDDRVVTAEFIGTIRASLRVVFPVLVTQIIAIFVLASGLECECDFEAAIFLLFHGVAAFVPVVKISA